jgi:hypothetical protein
MLKIQLKRNKMKALELYKFINENSIEWHSGNNGGQNDIVIFLLVSQIEDFIKIIPTSMFDDEGIDCIMKNGYFVFWMRAFCEYNDIELREVFDKGNFN